MNLRPLFTAGFSLLLLEACSDPVLRPSVPPGARVDTFPQVSASKLDVLWIVDNSCSMADKQQRVADGFHKFMDVFARAQVDYRLAITTTDFFNDHGRLVGNPSIISPSTPDPIGAFQRNIKVGISGKGLEQGFAAASKALDDQQQNAAAIVQQQGTCLDGCAGKPNIQACRDNCIATYDPPFMRPSAFLYIVFVSDEDDQSVGDVRYFWRAFEQAKGIGNDGTVGTAALIGDVPVSACPTADPGFRYADLVGRTAGVVGSVCDSNFEGTLKKLSEEAVGLQRKFTLSKTPDLTELTVVVKYRCDTPPDHIQPCTDQQSDCAGASPDTLGITCDPVFGGPDGWTYESASNSLFFNGTSVPGVKSQVEATYYVKGETP